MIDVLKLRVNKLIEENIIDNNICTLCNRKLFNSHRNNDIELNYALIIKR